MYLKDICGKTFDGTYIPSTFLVNKWLNSIPEFETSYVRARKSAAEWIVSEMEEIADDGRNDWMTNKEGHEVVNNEAIQRSRLRLDHRKWIAGKWNADYGDRLQVEHSGSITLLHKLPTEELEAEYMHLITTGALPTIEGVEYRVVETLALPLPSPEDDLDDYLAEMDL